MQTVNFYTSTQRDLDFNKLLDPVPHTSRPRKAMMYKNVWTVLASWGGKKWICWSFLADGGQYSVFSCPGSEIWLMAPGPATSLCLPAVFSLTSVEWADAGGSFRCQQHLHIHTRLCTSDWYSLQGFIDHFTIIISMSLFGERSCGEEHHQAWICSVAVWAGTGYFT